MTSRKSNRNQQKKNKQIQQNEKVKVAEKSVKTIEETCYILLYNYCQNNNISIPIYIDEVLGNTFIKNIDLVKTIEVKVNNFTSYATLQYAKKCSKEVYEFMSKMKSKICPELSNKVFEKLGHNIRNKILPLSDENEDVVFDYELEKKKEEIRKENVFKFDWNMDELTETTWDLIEWDYEMQDYIYGYKDKDKEEDQDQSSHLFEEDNNIYASDEEYEDKNKRMKFTRKYMYC